MRLFKIHSYVRCHLLEKVEHALLENDIRSFSVCRVRGQGEYANYFEQDHLVEHARIEIFLSEQNVELAIKVLLETASTNAAGDGIVAVMPVERLFRIRDKKEVVDRFDNL